MLITSVMLATKFFDDETFNNLYYAKVGGLQVSELNQLEEKFLALIDFSLTIPSDLFERYRCELMKHSKVNCPKVALSCSSAKASHETATCEPSRSSLSKSCGPSSAHSFGSRLRSSAPAAISSVQPPSLVRSACEALIIESVKNKSLHSSLMNRVGELLAAEEKIHVKLPPDTIKTVCTKLAAENDLSPTLATRAAAHAERLVRMEKMESLWYPTGCDYAARDSVLSPPQAKKTPEGPTLDFGKMNVHTGTTPLSSPPPSTANNTNNTNNNKGAAPLGRSAAQQCTPSAGYSTTTTARHGTNRNMVAV